MGGRGSGRKARKKRTVEACRAVDVRRWVREGDLELGYVTKGGYGWKGTVWGQGAAELHYTLDARDPERVTAQLVYQSGQQEQRTTVHLASDRPPVGGRRWWFVCPAAGCGQRVAALYTLPGRGAFACRRCHGLTYRSVQENHKERRRSYRRSAAQLGLTPENARREVGPLVELAMRLLELGQR